MDCKVETKIESESPSKKEKKSPQKPKKSAAGSSTNAADGAGTDDGTNGQKSYRKRKRHNYNAIRAQMEFYFGDANLSKDRFLKQLIDKDPFVPLEIFLSFNKLKALTTSVEEIAKSLSNSELLELDETQQKVRRKTALPADRNVDEKTLYVEALPSAADHEWVRQTFERFGPVVYVSLPKYSKTRKIKEFGFVEFEQESSVEKAVKTFQGFNGVLKMQEADPAELQSIRAYIKEQTEEKDTKCATAEVEKKKGKKRQRSKEEDHEDSKPEVKRVKTEDSCGTNSETGDGTTTNDDNEDKLQSTHDEDKNKKRRKKKKKSNVAEKRKKNTNPSTDASFYELKILPKREWKRLRNKYLNLQRERVAELKRKAWKEKQEQQHIIENTSAEVLDAAAPTPTKKQKPNERKLRKINMNFYGAGEDEQKNQAKEIKHNPALERAPLFSYAEGLIVELKFMEPCVNLKEFKADMRQYETVKYIDVKEGAMHAHLRLESATAASDFVRQVSCAEYNCNVVTGEAESEYWKKIEQDREMKLNKQIKVPQKRGREKVKKIIIKHLRFGDDDE